MPKTRRRIPRTIPEWIDKAQRVLAEDSARLATIQAKRGGPPGARASAARDVIESTINELTAIADSLGQLGFEAGQ